MNEATPINPQRVFWELSPRLPENCILTADSGSTAAWFARDLKIRRGMMASLSGNLDTMGRPVLLEVVTDPEVPPLPPHMTREQAVNFAKSIFKHDPNAGRMIRQALKEMLDNVIPTK